MRPGYVVWKMFMDLKSTVQKIQIFVNTNTK